MNLNIINYKFFKNKYILSLKYNKFLIILKNRIDNTKIIIYNSLYFKEIFYKKKNFYFFNYIDYLEFLNKIKKSIWHLLKGYSLVIDIIGLGYYITIIKNKKNLIRLQVGHNHCIYYFLPKGILFKTKRKKIFLFSFSFFLLKNVSIDILNFKKLSVYKLKGIKLKDELYVKKNWKKGIN